MKTGTLTKIFSTHNNLRTPTVSGVYDDLPSAGERFTLVGKSLSAEEGFRLVTTSPVEQTWKVSMGGRDVVCFKTENSVYGFSPDGENDDQIGS
jgi:hypothetical protein